MSDVVNEIQRAFIMLKPDAVERGLVGELISRLERKGLKPRRIEQRMISKELARKHYAHLLGKSFFQELEDYVTRGPVVAMIWEGRDAINVARRLVGATDPAEATAGTIRGDFGLDATENLVHASDSPEAAKAEIANFFGERA